MSELRRSDVEQTMEDDPLANSERLLAGVLDAHHAAFNVKPYGAGPLTRGQTADLEVALGELRRARRGTSVPWDQMSPRVWSERAQHIIQCCDCLALTSGSSGYPTKCMGCDSTLVSRIPMRPKCAMEGCDRPRFAPDCHAPGFCALHDMAFCDTTKLDEQAVAMANMARMQLAIEDGPYSLVPGIDY